MAFLLGCENIHLEYPAKKIFDSVTCGINTGDRIGIVGRNGDGKSSLLSLLSHSCEPDLGRVIQRSGTTIRVLGQTDDLNPEATVADEIVGDAPEYTWASNARIRSIIKGLIADIGWESRIGELSGGQRRRVNLARVLIDDCDVLMLDEPTNHLDVHAIAWLADHLKNRWPKKSGALLVVTHDRWFLDEVCSSMWEIHDGQIEPFEGGYSAYVLQRVEREQAAQTAEAKRRNLMRKELAWLSRGAQARSTKPKFRVEAARTLIANEPPVRNPLELKRTAVSRLGKRVVDLENITVRLDDTTVIDNATWRVGPGDRVGILGENGTGKTTLLNVIRGAIKPASGQVQIGTTVRFAVLSQHLAELHKLETYRVHEVLSRYKTRYEIDGKSVTPTQLLEHLGFETSHLATHVSNLSGGQKRRLQLMLILLNRPNVLILDEPDNDLDIDMLAVMENLLDTWPGTLLLITHDRHLMERVTDDQFALIDGKVVHLPGGVDEYLRLMDERIGKREESATGPRQGLKTTTASSLHDRATTPATKPSGNGSEKDQPALSRAEAYSLKKELASAERKLETLSTKANTTCAEMEMADPSDYVALGEIQGRLEAIQQQISELEDRWVEISERLS